MEQSKSVRNNLRERLEFEGYSTEGAENLANAGEMCRRIPFDIILSDSAAGIPDTDVPFIVMSADNTIESAVDALRHGAEDFITKPIDMNRLLAAIRRSVSGDGAEEAQPARRSRAQHSKRNVAASGDIEPIVGGSESILRVQRLIDKVAGSEAPARNSSPDGSITRVRVPPRRSSR